MRVLVAEGNAPGGAKDVRDALAESEARLAEAQRVAHVGSWQWEVGSNSVTWSDELFRIYGLASQQFDGSYEAFLSRVHPDDLDHTKAVVTQALQSVTPFIYDHRVVRPGGRTRMLHTRGDVLADADGRPIRMVGTCWDVTDRWEATQRLEHSISLPQSTLEATADGILVVDHRSGSVAAAAARRRWRAEVAGDWRHRHRLPAHPAGGLDGAKLG